MTDGYAYGNRSGDDEDNHEKAIDPLWEKQQKKTFTAWCNLHLKKMNSEISGIDKDFRSGVKLLQLLEIISGIEMEKPEKGKMRLHMISNVNKALAFINSQGVKLVSIGAEEIVDGNVKMTLGMIWTIILRFSIQNIRVDDLFANEGLLLWCQRSTAGYENVNVSNFNTSFKDGLAFCALINRYRPDLLNFNDLDKKNSFENLSKAFDVADKSLGIPAMLDPEDMCNSVQPDDHSVMAYVSCYYHIFAGAQKTSVAATRVCKAIERDQMSSQLTDEYTTLVTDLKKWIMKKQNEFEERNSQELLQEVEALLQDLRVYRDQEKPLKIEEKARLENTFRTLQTRLRLNNRPAYIPGDGMLIVDIIRMWKKLELCEKQYEEWLADQLKRMQNLEHWLRRFNVKCSTFEAWSEGKPENLRHADFKTGNLAEVRPMLKKHEAFESDLLAQQARVDRIYEITIELKNLGYHNMPTIEERYEKIISSWKLMKDLSDKRHENIENSVRILEQIDTMHLEIAKLAAPFNNWMQQAEEDLQDTFIAYSVSEVQCLIDDHKKFVASLPLHESECQKIQQLESEIKNCASTKNMTSLENPYAHVTSKELEDHWERILVLVRERQETLESAKQRQLVNEELQRQFADLADNLSSWLETTQGLLNSIVLGGTGSLEDQITSLGGIENSLTENRSKLDEIETCNQKLQNALVFQNKFSSVTMETLRSTWNQLLTGLKSTRNEVENQILTRDSKGLSKSQLDDLRRTFNHFDKSKNGSLDMCEFKACLVAIGHKIGSDDNNQQDDKRRSVTMLDTDILNLMRKLDSEHSECISFDVFVNYMTRELTDQDSSDQLRESFKTISGDKGYLTADDLRRELPTAQAEYCISKLKPLTQASGESNALDFEFYVVHVYGTQ